MNRCVCGCGQAVRKRFARGHNTKTRTHGLAGSIAKGTRSPTYVSWNKMLQRCTNPNHARWNSYGGRGIKVCDRWRSFANFLADMGERPGVDHCLSRIDHGRDYEPGNVEWELKSANNREACERSRLWEASPCWQRGAA